MTVTPTNQREADARDEELKVLRTRVAQLEHELAEQAAGANAQIAEAQRRMYWLDRLELDLNTTLSRPWLAFVVTAPLKAVRRLRYENGRLLRRLRR